MVFKDKIVIFVIETYSIYLFIKRLNHVNDYIGYSFKDFIINDQKNIT